MWAECEQGSNAYAAQRGGSFVHSVSSRSFPLPGPLVLFSLLLNQGTHDPRIHKTRTVTDYKLKKQFDSHFFSLPWLRQRGQECHLICFYNNHVRVVALMEQWSNGLQPEVGDGVPSSSSLPPFPSSSHFLLSGITCDLAHSEPLGEELVVQSVNHVSWQPNHLNNSAVVNR